MSADSPRYFGEGQRYGGFAIGAGWFPIIESLIRQIDSYTKWKRNGRAYELRIMRAKAKGRDAVLKFVCKGRQQRTWDEERVDDIMVDDNIVQTEKVEWIRVAQIKEKFGGLRFYYDGGDDRIEGMVTMAEIWAGHTCETCGNKGKRRDGGWIRTLCDHHEELHQSKLKGE